MVCVVLECCADGTTVAFSSDWCAGEGVCTEGAIRAWGIVEFVVVECWLMTGHSESVPSFWLQVAVASCTALAVGPMGAIDWGRGDGFAVEAVEHGCPATWPSLPNEFTPSWVLAGTRMSGCSASTAGV